MEIQGEGRRITPEVCSGVLFCGAENNTTEMSIETLLEAAKFLELQAEQQQKTRGKKKKDCVCVRARVLARAHTYC